MISVEPLSADEWQVTVSSATITQHRVRVSAAELKRFGKEASPSALLEASFRFLLDRESNTSILRAFDLSEITRYFPEYEREIARYLAP